MPLLHLVSLLGFAVAVLGLGLATAPRPTSLFLRLLGIRRIPGPNDRAAGWALCAIGLVVAFVGRLAR